MWRWKDLMGFVTAMALMGSIAVRLWLDLTQPENWDGTFLHDPHVYWPYCVFVGGIAAFIACLLVRDRIRDRRFKERLSERNKRFNDLIEQSKEHLRQGRLAEAWDAARAARELHEERF
jgi:hypothetical protein